MNHHNHHRTCPNSLLTTNEKETKRYLKELLKHQTKIRKYEVRYRQAVARGDIHWTKQSLYDLYLYIQKMESGSTNKKNDISIYDNNANNNTQLENTGTTGTTGTSSIDNTIFLEEKQQQQQHHHHHQQQQQQQQNKEQNTNADDTKNCVAGTLDPYVKTTATLTANTTNNTIELDLEILLHRAESIISKLASTIHTRTVPVPSNSNSSSNNSSNSSHNIITSSSSTSSLSSLLTRLPQETTLASSCTMHQEQQQQQRFHWSLWNNDTISSMERIARDYIESVYHELQKRLLLLEQQQQQQKQKQKQKQQSQQTQLQLQHQHQHQQQQQVDDHHQLKEKEKEIVDIVSERDYWLQRSRDLCKNMTKGTQTKRMFHDRAALLGYTRTKFIERSILIVQSLSRLHSYVMLQLQVQVQVQLQIKNKATTTIPTTTTTTTTTTTVQPIATPNHIILYKRIAKHLFGIVTENDNDNDDNNEDDDNDDGLTVCSIGCGPGCDGVGVVAFYNQTFDNCQRKQHHLQPDNHSAQTTQSYNGKQHNRNSYSSNSCHRRFVKKVVYMDYAMKQWEPIVQHVKDIIIEKNKQQQQQQQHQQQCQQRKQLREDISPERLVLLSSLPRPLSIDMVTCDVRKPIIIDTFSAIASSTSTDDKQNRMTSSPSLPNIDIEQQRQQHQQQQIGRTTTDTDDSTNDTFKRKEGIEATIEADDEGEEENPNTYFSRMVQEEQTTTLKTLEPATPLVGIGGRQTCKQFDIIVISYLLSETRDKWYIFMDDLFRNKNIIVDTNSSIGKTTIVLVTDPTAWQLHIFRDRYNDIMEFIWLDSSMYRPELQILEGRVGPAVLLGIVK